MSIRSSVAVPMRPTTLGVAVALAVVPVLLPVADAGVLPLDVEPPVAPLDPDLALVAALAPELPDFGALEAAVCPPVWPPLGGGLLLPWVLLPPAVLPPPPASLPEGWPPVPPAMLEAA